MAYILDFQAQDICNEFRLLDTFDIPVNTDNACAALLHLDGKVSSIAAHIEHRLSRQVLGHVRLNQLPPRFGIGWIRRIGEDTVQINVVEPSLEPLDPGCYLFTRVVHASTCIFSSVLSQSRYNPIRAGSPALAAER